MINRNSLFSRSTLASHQLQAASEYLTFQRISEGGFEIPDEAEVPPEAQDLISRLLVLEPSQRLGVTTVADR